MLAEVEWGPVAPDWGVSALIVAAFAGTVLVRAGVVLADWQGSLRPRTWLVVAPELGL